MDRREDDPYWDTEEGKAHKEELGFSAAPFRAAQEVAVAKSKKKKAKAARAKGGKGTSQ